MKVVWITNIPVGKLCESTNTNLTSGGWMESMINSLKSFTFLDLYIITPWKNNVITKIEDKNIHYILIPGGLPIQYRYRKKNNIKIWKNLIEDIKPDIVHIHGTEYSHGFALIKAYPELKYVISIQGLCNVIADYYYSGIKFGEILRNITIRDIIRLDTLFQAKWKLKKRGELEIRYLKNVKHVIGRTTWDYVHVKAINNNLNYHFCNEILRESFYNTFWDIRNIRRHSIFISQASLPFKGFHIVLKSLNILKSKYKDIKVYISGYNNCNSKKFSDKLRINGYSKYIKHIIRCNSLDNYITFLGNQDAKEMAENYRKAHVFICPSSIENSPNSLGEAQLVGTPCIASYTGGIPDMVKDNNSGLLFPFQDFYMLAHKIDKVFSNDQLALKISNGGKQSAIERHDKNINANQQVKIYSDILNHKEYR